MSYIDRYKKESLVYLTADSPNVIHTLDKEKNYIIGGIVDRNRHKGITYEIAKKQGIATGRLPLDTVVHLGEASRVLTVNHGKCRLYEKTRKLNSHQCIDSV